MAPRFWAGRETATTANAAVRFPSGVPVAGFVGLPSAVQYIRAVHAGGFEDFKHGDTLTRLKQLIRRFPVGAELRTRAQLGEYVVEQRQIPPSGLLCRLCAQYGRRQR